MRPPTRRPERSADRDRARVVEARSRPGAARPIVQYPASCSASSERAMLTTRTSGSHSTPPAAALTSAGESCGARSRASSTRARSGRLGRAQQRADVARIGHLVENQHDVGQTRAPALRAAGRPAAARRRRSLDEARPSATRSRAARSQRSTATPAASTWRSDLVRRVVAEHDVIDVRRRAPAGRRARRAAPTAT